MTEAERAAITGLDYNTLALKVVTLEAQLCETRSNGEALRLRVAQLEAQLRVANAVAHISGGPTGDYLLDAMLSGEES